MSFLTENGGQYLFGIRYRSCEIYGRSGFPELVEVVLMWIFHGWPIWCILYRIVSQPGVTLHVISPPGQVTTGWLDHSGRSSGCGRDTRDTTGSLEKLPMANGWQLLRLRCNLLYKKRCRIWESKPFVEPWGNHGCLWVVSLPCFFVLFSASSNAEYFWLMLFSKLTGYSDVILIHPKISPRISKTSEHKDNVI